MLNCCFDDFVVLLLVSVSIWVLLDLLFVVRFVACWLFFKFVCVLIVFLGWFYFGFNSVVH